MNFRRFAFSLVLLITSFTYAQNRYKQGSFVIKGNVKNTKSPLIDYIISSYFDVYSGSIVIRGDGNFEQQIPIQYRQNISLITENDDINFYAEDKDTIQLSWDDSGFKNSFSVKSNNADRTKELQLQTQMHFEFAESLYQVEDSLYEKTSLIARLDALPYKTEVENDKMTTELAGFELVNDLYNLMVNRAIILSDSLSFSDVRNVNVYYLITDLYFQCSDLLRRFKLLPKFELKLTEENISNMWHQKRRVVDDMYRKLPDYHSLNESWFWNAPGYRSFVFDYVRFNTSFNTWQPDSNSATKIFHPTLDAYYLAQSQFNIINIRDWFIVKTIFRDLSNYDFTNVENVYKQAIGSITNTYLKDTLRKHYTAVSRLKPGSPAPVFLLENDKGQSVSLSDFKGKVVYLDFWGVHCGPCIRNMKEVIPGIQEYYKNKDVVFINICVDSKKEEWKEALVKYKPDGINLIADGVYNLQMYKSYHLFAVPHYVLIDKNGKMVSNNNSQVVYPQMLDLTSGTNAIDMLLK